MILRDDHGRPLDPNRGAILAFEIAGLVDDIPAIHAKLRLLRQDIGPTAYAYTVTMAITTLAESVISAAFELLAAYHGPDLRAAYRAIARGENPDQAAWIRATDHGPG